MASYTPKQMEIMRFIHDYRMRTGSSPTLGEIGAALGVHRVTIHQHVSSIVAKGGITKDKSSSLRNLVVVEPSITGAPSGSQTYENLRKHLGHTVVIGEDEHGSVSLECMLCGKTIIEEKKPK